MNKKSSFGLTKNIILPKSNSAFKQIFPLTKKLELILKSNRKIKTTPNQIIKWNWALLKYSQRNNISPEHINLLLNYLKEYHDDEYFPQVRNGIEFVNKIKNIEDFIQRKQAKHIQADPKKVATLMKSELYIEEELGKRIVFFYDEAVSQLHEIKIKNNAQGRAAKNILNQLSFGYYVQTLKHNSVTSSNYKWLFKKYMSDIGMVRDFDAVSNYLPVFENIK